MIAGSYDSSIFNFLEEPPYYFPEWLHQFTFPPKAHKGSLFSTFLPTLVISYFFDDGHSKRCEMISHGGFDMHFPDD